MIVPTVRQFGDVIVALYPGSRIVLEFTRFAEHRATLTAELTVSNELGPLHWSRINLASATGRRDVIKALEEVHPVEGWRGMLDGACQAVALFRRSGEPAVAMQAKPPKPDRWLITDWIPRGEITVIYGPGGSAKSLLCLAIGLAGILGHTLGGPWAVGPLTKMLYLDWEDSLQTQEERIWGLTHTLEAPPAGAVLYRRLRRPLVDVIETVRTDAWKHEVDYVVMDSLGAACGPEPETAGAVLDTLQAFGTLPGTKVVSAHVSKADAQQARGKPFGSVYVENTARSCIEARGVRDGPQIAVTLRHDKTNRSLARPVGVTATFDEDGTIVLTTTKPDMAANSLADRVLAMMPPDTKWTAKRLATETDSPLNGVRTSLRRLAEKGKVIQLESVSGGRGKESQWQRVYKTDSRDA